MPIILKSEETRLFWSNPDNLFLISFPRTGSHWLRMLIEKCFDRPLLTRTFFYHSNRDFLLLHDHDLTLEVFRPNVIYLYRRPVQTIYSYLRYYDVAIEINEVGRAVDLYNRHLLKWLVEDKFTKRKLVIQYEDIEKSCINVLHRVAEFCGLGWNEELAFEAGKEVTRELVHALSRKYDDRAINLESEYKDGRMAFAEQYGKFIWRSLSPEVVGMLE